MSDLAKRVAELEKEILLLREGSRSNPYRRKYTKQEFKLVFKIGDHICGWGTGKTVRITAIGESRFLARDLYTKGEERVCSIESLAWVKIEPQDEKEELK